jgi:hypothetical protein
MDRADCKKYLQMLGQELQMRQITGEISICGRVIILLAIKKPQGRKNIGAYLQGDESAIEIPIDIVSYFDRNDAAIREAVKVVEARESLPDDWLNEALQHLFYVQPLVEKWIEYPGIRMVGRITKRREVLALVLQYVSQEDVTLDILRKIEHSLKS